MRNTTFDRNGLFHNDYDLVFSILIPLTIIASWIASLVWLFSVDVSKLTIWGIVPAVLVRTFLHTGLFITAHDAMHGTLFPKNRFLNDFIGALGTNVYALLSYRTLLQKHIMHHRYPASKDDPDFYEETANNAFLWYFKFMRGSLDKKQIWILLMGMVFIFSTLRGGWHIPISNLILFWVLPMILSSVQLFYFGIFLPHRQSPGGYDNLHRASSSYYSCFWSFISCYHFGYHWEHHEYPHLPWYKLPSTIKIVASKNPPPKLFEDICKFFVK